MVFWFCLVLLGGLIGVDFVRESEDMMKAPENSRSAKDKEAFAAVFPQQADANPSLVLLKCKDSALDCTVTCPAAKCSRDCAGCM